MSRIYSPAEIRENREEFLAQSRSRSGMFHQSPHDRKSLFWMRSLRLTCDDPEIDDRLIEEGESITEIEMAARIEGVKFQIEADDWYEREWKEERDFDETEIILERDLKRRATIHHRIDIGEISTQTAEFGSPYPNCWDGFGRHRENL